MRTGFLGGDHQLDMTITVPSDSSLAIKTGSADVTARGSYRSGQVKSGSGDVSIEIFDGPAVVETGSGDVRIDAADQELQDQERLRRHPRAVRRRRGRDLHRFR